MSAPHRSTILMLLGILFLALNLRGPFTSVAPVLTQVMDGLQLTPSSAGFLTALPLLTFALFSPLVTNISQKLGLERSLLLCLLLISCGIILRSFGLLPSLYFGTILIGMGIATGNVLLPVVVKVNFPSRIGVVTSLYILTMGIGATLSSSLMVPISKLTIFSITGWQLALLMNLLFPLLALAIWLPKIKEHNATKSSKDSDKTSPSPKKLLYSSVAWQVTLALGLNSFTFYSLAGWLPKILNDLGYSATDSGYIYGFLQFSTMIPGLLLLPFLSRKNGQQILITICALSVFIGLIGLLYLPDFAIFWVGLFGLGNCSTFTVALSFIALRTSNAAEAATLSGMSQGIGYALAATGPTLIGYIQSQNGSWNVPILAIAFVALLCTLFAALAARDKKV